MVLGCTESSPIMINLKGSRVSRQYFMCYDLDLSRELDFGSFGTQDQGISKGDHVKFRDK